MILKTKTATDVGKVIVGEAAPLVDVVPAHRRLADVETSLVREIKREAFLRRALRGHTDPYDIVLIDCPPNLGLLPVNALCAADEAVVIDMKSVDALAGAEELIATAEALEEDGPRVTALVRNRVEGSANRRRQVYAAIDEALGQLDLPVARTLIPARTVSRRPRSCKSHSWSGVRTTSARWRFARWRPGSTPSQHEPARDQATGLTLARSARAPAIPPKTSSHTSSSRETTSTTQAATDGGAQQAQAGQRAPGATRHDSSEPRFA